jgi:hypothetical protein
VVGKLKGMRLSLTSSFERAIRTSDAFETPSHRDELVECAMEFGRNVCLERDVALWLWTSSHSYSL